MNDMRLNMQALVANPSTSSTMDLEKMQSLEVDATVVVQFRLMSQGKFQGMGGVVYYIFSSFHHYVLHAVSIGWWSIVLISLPMMWFYVYSIILATNPAIRLT